MEEARSPESLHQDQRVVGPLQRGQHGHAAGTAGNHLMVDLSTDELYTKPRMMIL